MNANKISLSNFTFKFTGHGHYYVTFTSFKTGMRWGKTITDMNLIDNTKNAEYYPKQKDLQHLKYILKNKGEKLERNEMYKR